MANMDIFGIGERAVSVQSGPSGSASVDPFGLIPPRMAEEPVSEVPDEPESPDKPEKEEE